METNGEDKMICRYCTNPAADGYPICSFHLDWEAACNIVEDECGGSTPGSMVVGQMIEWGYTAEAIDEERAKVTV